jgi:hypothetical protein
LQAAIIFLKLQFKLLTSAKYCQPITPLHKTKLSTRLEEHNKTPSHCPFTIMGNDLSSPNMRGTTPHVDATSEFQKRCRRRGDWDKESLSSTQLLSELLKWDEDNDAAADATGQTDASRSITIVVIIIVIILLPNLALTFEILIHFIKDMFPKVICIIARVKRSVWFQLLLHKSSGLLAVPVDLFGTVP